jgi:hypothetical protein
VLAARKLQLLDWIVSRMGAFLGGRAKGKWILGWLRNLVENSKTKNWLGWEPWEQFGRSMSWSKFGGRRRRELKNWGRRAGKFFFKQPHILLIKDSVTISNICEN